MRGPRAARCSGSASRAVDALSSAAPSRARGEVPIRRTSTAWRAPSPSASAGGIGSPRARAAVPAETRGGGPAPAGVVPGTGRPSIFDWLSDITKDVLRHDFASLGIRQRTSARSSSTRYRRRPFKTTKGAMIRSEVRVALHAFQNLRDRSSMILSQSGCAVSEPCRPGCDVHSTSPLRFFSCRCWSIMLSRTPANSGGSPLEAWLNEPRGMKLHQIARDVATAQVKCTWEAADIAVVLQTIDKIEGRTRQRESLLRSRPYPR